MGACLGRHRKSVGPGEWRPLVFSAAQHGFVGLVVCVDQRADILVPPAQVPLGATLDVGMQVLIRVEHPLLETTVDYRGHDVGTGRNHWGDS